MKSFVKDMFKSLIVSFAIVVLIITFIACPVNVQGHSMEPTLADGSYGIAGVFTRFLGLKRFDIVVIKTDASENRLIKRIIGLPNEKVTYKDNKLYINDQFIEEPFLSDTVTEDFEIVLNDDQYFVLGDNRLHSSDSRYYGPFEASEIITRGLWVIIGG